MSATCPSCGCVQPSGLLCSDDTAALQVMLAAAPQLIDQLQVAIGKQARLTSVGKAAKGSAHEKTPINFGALAVRDALLAELALWGDDTAAIRRHPQAAEIVSGIGRAVKDAYRAIDRTADRQYLGQCLVTEDGAVCHAELWVKPGAHQVACSQCETVHDVPKRRAKLVERAEDMIVTPREASQYLGEVGDIPVGHQRIRNYLDRGRIARRPSVDGSMRLRLGDLLDVLRDEASRKESRAS